MRFDSTVQCLHVIDEIDFLHEFLIANYATKLPIIFMDLRVHGEAATVFQSEISDVVLGQEIPTTIVRWQKRTYIFPQSSHCHFCCSFFF